MKEVLVVDDTKNIRNLLTTCLELKNYKVITAEDGKSAIDIVSKENSDIDIIFLDIRMPEMNGTEVLKKIRDMGVKCPVIIMTAYATVKNAIDCTRLGAVAYLQKPFSPDRVSSVLDEIIASAENFEIKENLIQEEENAINRVKELIAEEKYEEAHLGLKSALAINPYNKEIYKLISQVNMETNDIDKAKLFKTIYELFNNLEL